MHAPRLKRPVMPLRLKPSVMLCAFFALTAGVKAMAQNFLVVPHEDDTSIIVPALAIAGLLAGSGIAFLIYRNREHEPLHASIIRQRFYFDQFYAWLIEHSQELLSRIANFIDRSIIDGAAVRGASGATFGIGSLLRLLQVGNLRAYAFLFGLGIVAIIYFVIFR